MANERFQNALNRKIQNVPPVWMMRQAGRYHWHYQNLRSQNTFDRLCKDPELASEVAMGPVQDFDFDLAILFSDILFPLEGLGLGLEYTDKGPQFDWHIQDMNSFKKMKPVEEAIEFMNFQKDAVRLTREKLPDDKSLIGFIGGPWTLFTYAATGKHEGSLVQAKKLVREREEFFKIITKLLNANIQLQLDAGAEVVMIFDTAAGELCPVAFDEIIIPNLGEIIKAHSGKVGYYMKNAGQHQVDKIQALEGLAGMGVDHRVYLPDMLRSSQKGFLQGNFDQAMLFQDEPDFKKSLGKYIDTIKELSPEERAGWVCGLGHGVLPKTPEKNVRTFVETVREAFA